MKEKQKKKNIFYHSVRNRGKTFLRWIIVTKEEKRKEIYLLQ